MPGAPNFRLDNHHETGSLKRLRSIGLIGHQRPLYTAVIDLQYLHAGRSEDACFCIVSRITS
jgi:hypothetical protein